MINAVLAKVFGTSNERAVKRLLPTLAQINALDETIGALSDEQLQAKTAELKARIAKALDGLTDPTRLPPPKKPPWTIFFLKPSPSYAKRAAGLSACAISMCR